MRRLEDALKEELQRCWTTCCRKRLRRSRRRAGGWSARRSRSRGSSSSWDMVPYDVQLIGGVALHRGKVAEMATGEGKTLVATMPVYLNALAGRGVHLVTVNTYLAQRDSEWMGTIYRYLGLTVDCIDLHEPGSPERRGCVQRRHHVRHEQRVRLRLPARQHGARPGAARAAAALLRDHRRGRLDPHR
jgi:hypothetical protein